MEDDFALLQRFVHEKSHDAFTQLVRRYVDVVFATCFRCTRDRHLAEDVTQAVFIILARRAASISPDTLLPGWLHRAARYASANAIKMNARRKQHERQAGNARAGAAAASEAGAQSELSPVLDDALAKLREVDRSAIILRYWQHKSVEETGGCLGLSTEAAKKRLQRALAKLREILSRQGVMFSSLADSEHAIVNVHRATPAPVGVESAVLRCVQSGGLQSGAGLIAKGALTMMMWAKLRVLSMVLVALLTVTGAGAWAFSKLGSRGAGHHVAETSADVFAAVIERTVNDDGVGKDETIDFDTGKLHSHPGPFRDRAEGREWFRSTGADAHCETETGAAGLFAMEMEVYPVENEAWDTTDPAKLHELTDGVTRVPNMSAEDGLPRTFIFHTREGGVGICQLLEMDRGKDEHGWIKLRYKLVVSAEKK